MPIALLPFLLMFSGQAANEPEGDADAWVVARQDREITIPAGTAIVASNPHGTIRVRGRDGDVVELIANVQKRRVNPAEAKIESELRDGTLFIEVAFPGEDRPEWKKKPRRVDLTLVVPKRAPISLEVLDELIEVKGGYQGNVTAKARMGELFVKTKGSVDLSCRQGEITVFMNQTKWSEDSSIEMVHGKASIFFFDGANAELDIVTGGKLTTDFTAVIETRPLKKEKKAKIKLGQGGKRFEIRSHQGQVEILRFFDE